MKIQSARTYYSAAFLTTAFSLHLLIASAAWSASFIGYGEGGAPTNIIATPDRIYSWNIEEVTWKMDSDFRLYFHTEELRDQVRLAFDEWEEAMTSVIKRANPNYTWRRYNGQKDTHDLRTVINHELGHVLGSQHPDASWFNSGYMRNYRPDGNGGWIAAAPIGGELMNEGNEAGKLPNSKPDRGLEAGEYHRLLSQDELAFLDHAYNGPLTFKEVGVNDQADIVLTMHNIGGVQGNNLGHAGIEGDENVGWVWRDQNDDDAGRRIIQGSLSLNANPTTLMGIMTRPSKWEFTNDTGKSVKELALRTRGTDNPAAFDINSAGPNRFQNITTENTIFVPNLEDKTRRFLNPVGGSIPNGGIVSVGLTLDVWDWQLVDAEVKAVDNSIFDAEMVVVFDWQNNGQPIPPIPDQSPPPDIITADPDGLGSKTYEIIADGFRIVNNSVTTTVISELAIAPVPNIDPTLDNLSTDTMDQLDRDGELIHFSIAPITLAPDEEYFFVLEGTTADLPPDMLLEGNFQLLDRPDLAGQQLFVHTGTGNASDPDRISNFTFLNTPAHTMIPEPTSAALLVLGALVIAWPGRNRVKAQY